jgi:hypothetical protein
MPGIQQGDPIGWQNYSGTGGLGGFSFSRGSHEDHDVCGPDDGGYS